VLRTLEAAHGVRRYGCDSSNADAVARLFGEVVADLGAPTLVVHNIDGCVEGIFRKGITEADPELALQALTNAAYSAFLVGQAAARLMLDNPVDASGGRGSIIFTNASAALKGFANSGAFAMACQAKTGLAQSMARELMPKGRGRTLANVRR
jgi:NAD(P)-dependent dehydrogenase (short-subunit alcohol dehydrogenase family)